MASDSVSYDDNISDHDDTDSGEDEEETTEINSAQQESTAEQFKQLLMKEEEEVNVIKKELEESDNVEKKLVTYSRLANILLSKSAYQDITPLFVDGTPFILDGLSLLTMVLQDSNYSQENGGQTLHFIYLCERIIELVCRKGGSCEVVFFDDVCSILKKIPEYELLLTVLKTHLKKNTNILVYEMETIASQQFVKYIEQIHPCFMIINFTMMESIFNTYLSNKLMIKTVQLIKNNFVFIQALGFYCVDLRYIILNNKMYSFVCSSNIATNLKTMQKNLIDYSVMFVKHLHCDIKLPDIPKALLEATYLDIKEFVALNVASLIQNDTSLISALDKEEIIKLYFMYYAISKCLPLRCRSFKATSFSDDRLKLLVPALVKFIDATLKKVVDGVDCCQLADIWNGNLFEYVFWYVNITNKLTLGNKLQDLYEKVLEKFNTINETNLVKYPILSNVVDTKKKEKAEIETLFASSIGKTSNCIRSQLMVKQDTNDTSNPKILDGTLNEIITKFCADIVPVYRDSCVQELLKEIVSVNTGYEEKYHWHNLKMITDEFDRIRDNKEETSKMPLHKQLREKAKFCRYISMYGSNIEGKYLENEPIIVCDENKSKNTKKKQKKLDKVSSKALQIIKNNVMDKQNKVLDEEKLRYNNFVKEFKSNKSATDGTHKNYNLVNLYLLKMLTDEYKGNLMLYKIEILHQFWIMEHNASVKHKIKVTDVSHLKELFLTIRLFLGLTVKAPSLLSENNAKLISNVLSSIGFSPLADKWKLPITNNASSNKYCLPENLTYITFQLTHLSSELEHKTLGVEDDRVSDFIPDPWQKKLFDIVDKSESALIVAPTSSGKTYASYYCMKKVLKESNEGRIIYVAPTKALVNQVAATVYARFHTKKMPPGRTVYGIFTRDYRYDAMDCQILVTVPECLELLLMSPRQYQWVKSLKYVIFDEVHCLAGGAGEGVVWERCLTLIPCPFLALSATIQNPREFWSWMSDVEAHKKSLNPKMGAKVHLVVHSERHNDLIKNVYGIDKKFHHIHPYSSLNNRVMKVHDGVPNHISLSPHEALELYNCMFSVNPTDKTLLALEPDKYFSRCETGFINREEARDYEKQLKDIINNWYNIDKKLFQNTVEVLHQPLKVHEKGTQSLPYFLENLVTIVEEMRKSNMLPAIVFSYNRGLCEVLGMELAKHFKNLEDKSTESKKQSKRIGKKNIDDDELDDEMKSKSKKVKQSNFETSGKPERRKRDTSDLFPLEITSSNATNTLRGQYEINNKDLQFIERRLSREFKKTSSEVDQLRRGVGVHHAGIVTKLRQSVEMLFRTKFLSVVFATGTLALGIHMPCKTVIVLGDSPFLNTLEYHQMSGRSGRRGFDKVGNVIFFGIDSNKTRILMTSKLPRMMGNFPLSITTVLRVLLLVSDVTENKVKTDESYNDTINRALTMLNESLLFRTQKNLRQQMKHFVLFSCQLLMLQRLIDDKCKPMLMANIVTHLHYHEPGNLAFVYLLRSGVIAKMCSKTKIGKVDETACNNVVNLLARLFTKLPLKKELLEQDLKNSVVVLPDLPDFVTQGVEKYNAEVKQVFKRYFRGFSQHITQTLGEDDKLPTSGKSFTGIYSRDELLGSSGGGDESETMEKVIARCSKDSVICSAFAGLSGQSDEELYSQNSLISNIRHQVFTDCKVVPFIDFENPLNGYAYDFYRHGIIKSIIEDNGLKVGSDYQLLQDFLLVLQTLHTSLMEFGMSCADTQLENALHEENLNTCVTETFRHITETFQTFFNKTYNIKDKY